MPKHLGNKIKKIRDSYNLSQDRFAKKIGVSGKSISAYETGRTTPSLRVLEKITEVYKTPIINVNKDIRQELQQKFDILQKELLSLGKIILDD